MQLIRGQKLKLSDVLNNPLSFSLATTPPSNLNLDIALFGLDSQGKLSDEAYMIFYNQPQSPCGSLKLSQNTGQQVSFDVNLATLPPQIERLVLTLTIDGHQTMAQLPAMAINLQSQQQKVVSFPIDGSMFQQEKALMALELYKKDNIWRMNAVGQGFNGGLAALIKHFGGEVAETVPTQAAPTTPQLSKIDLKKKISLEKAEKTGNASIIDLTKKSLVQLEKKNLLDVQARVALVLDASGSMNHQYHNGDVQKVVDRLMPLAINFDNDGSFECWAFAQYTTQLDDVTLTNEVLSPDIAKVGKLSFTQKVDFSKIKAAFKEEILRGEGFFVHFEELFIIDGQSGLIRISFGANERNEKSYLWIDKGHLSYLPDTVLATTCNKDADKLIKEWVYGTCN